MVLRAALPCPVGAMPKPRLDFDFHAHGAGGGPHILKTIT